MSIHGNSNALTKAQIKHAQKFNVLIKLYHELYILDMRQERRSAAISRQLQMQVGLVAGPFNILTQLPYGGKIWQGETLANNHKFAKFKPSKFYFLKDLEA